MTELKNYLKPLTDKNAQLVTRAKSKRAVGGNLKGIATKIFCANLTVLCSEMPASSQPENVIGKWSATEK